MCIRDRVDTYYEARRKNGVVVSLACNEPEETCFCGAFGIDATKPAGDVATWIVNDNLYWKPLTCLLYTSIYEGTSEVQRMVISGAALK